MKWERILVVGAILSGMQLTLPGKDGSYNSTANLAGDSGDTVMYAATGETSGNPIITHIRCADPAAEVWNDGRVWIYASHDQEDATDYSNMDGYHVFSSHDLVNWTDHGEILHSRDVSWGNPGGGWMFAPDAAYRNGIYYLYYPHLSNEWRWRIGVATSTRPEGPFTDVGHFIEGTDNIDPACFVDEDGQAYLLWGGGDVGTSVPKIARLRENMIELAEEPRIIEYGAANFGEGGYLHKRDSLYYFSYTCHSCWPYQGYYAIGDNPYGPFEYKGELNRSPPGAQDHHSVIEYHDQWYYFYHVGNYEGGSLHRRNICIDSLFYNEDGTMQEVRQTTTGVGSDLIGSTAGRVVPGRFEAEDYFRSQGTGTSSEGDSVILVDQVEKGDWIEFVLDVLGSETYDARIRLADPVADTRIVLMVDESVTDTLVLSSDTSLVSVPLFLHQGKHTWKLLFDHPDVAGELLKVDWIELKGNIEYFSIEASVEGGGSFEPAGTTYYARGDTATLSVEADFNHILDSVWIDGILQPLSQSYTFYTLSENHTIKASFSPCILSEYTPYHQVNLEPPVTGTGVVITEGNTLKLWVDHDSATILSWEGPDGFISTDRMVVLENIRTAQQGIYTFRLVNQQGCQTEQQIEVGVAFAELDVYEAEQFVDQSGIGLETSTDLGGGKYVANIEHNDWCEYTLSLDQPGYYLIMARIATGSDGGSIEISNRDSLVVVLPVEGSLSEGWDDWITTEPVEARFNAGFHRLKFMFSGGDGTLFNFNWFDLEYSRGLPQDTSTGLPVELRTFPNPFVSGTRIAFSLDKTSQIDLKIYSSTGQLIKTLVANETFASGNYQFTWNATDNDQGPLQAGIYIIRFMCNHQVTNAKVVLLSGNGNGTFSQFP